MKKTRGGIYLAEAFPSPLDRLRPEILATAGPDAARRGLTLWRDGQVEGLWVRGPGAYEGSVRDARGSYQVTVTDRPPFNVYCNCFRGPCCEHAVALMLQITARGEGSDAGAADEEATALLIRLFAAETSPLADASGPRTVLRTQYGLFASTPRFTQTDRMLISIGIGPKRTYLIKDVERFLTRAYDWEPLRLTPSFTYDPAAHTFSERDLAIFEILQELEEVQVARTPEYRKVHVLAPGDAKRYLVIPPRTWERLWPHLKESSTLFNQLPLNTEPLPLPLQATLRGLGHELFELKLSGLDRLEVFPSYDLAVVKGAVYELPPGYGARLYALYSRGYAGLTGAFSVRIPGHQIEAVLSHVLPGLKGIVPVTVSARLKEAVVDAPLTALLYLEGAEGPLVGRLEFRYGSAKLNPLSSRQEASRALVVRDRFREQQVLALLQQYGFATHDERLVLDDEDRLFRFLTEGIPALEPVIELYATDTLDPILRPSRFTPRVRLDFDGPRDWLEVSFEIGDIDPDEVKALLQAIIERRPYHRLKRGSFLALDPDDTARVAGLLTGIGLSSADLASGRARTPASRALALAGEDEDAHNDAVRIGERLRGWLHDLRHPQDRALPIPHGLHASLRDYQRRGFEWLTTLARFQLGGILADDMGLGKTLQSIAFLLSEREAGPFPCPALVVSPASLMYNWLAEFRRFAPALRVAVVDGSPEARADRLGRAAEADVLITSYPLLRRDETWYREHPFYALILDEAQAIKNWHSQTAEICRAIPSPRRFALTGTPVENSLDDLWSIFQAVLPELFGSHEAFLRLNPEAVARRARPFILRRLKRDVLSELPPKLETVRTADLTVAQKKLYLAYLERIRQETVAALGRQGFYASRLKILAGITRLRQLCCHPALVVDGYDGQSGKMECLLELIEEAIASDRRMLLFSQFTSMLALIRESLDSRGVRYHYLDGQTPSTERLSMAEDFNQGDAPLFLISLKAGGTGLNLIGADTVILYDLWWNPAVEEQAADRAHRIGQTRSVEVIRLITQGTIEEKIHALQQQKRALIDRVVGAQDDPGGALTEADVRELLSL